MIFNVQGFHYNYLTGTRDQSSLFLLYFPLSLSSVEDQTAVIAALVIGISLAVLLILVASVLALLLCVNKFGK